MCNAATWNASQWKEIRGEYTFLVSCQTSQLRFMFLYKVCGAEMWSGRSGGSCVRKFFADPEMS
jgi:hypothetical protein